MPRLALVLFALWFVSLFAFRTALQWRKTGATGIKGFHGPVGSLGWWAGASVMIGFVLAPLAPVAALHDWPLGEFFASNGALHLAGAALALVGIAGALLAQLAMGDSWRIGVDESERTQLVTSGLFAWVRNPIFSFVALSSLGFVLLVPNALSLLAALLVGFGIEAQVRAVEEPYLRQTHGPDYDRYAASVGRFVPGLGRMAGHSDR